MDEVSLLQRAMAPATTEVDGGAGGVTSHLPVSLGLLSGITGKQEWWTGLCLGLANLQQLRMILSRHRWLLVCTETLVLSDSALLS